MPRIRERTRSGLSVRASCAVIVAVGIGFMLAVANAQPQMCVVGILNRVAEVRPDGSWQINNLPAGLGLVRARFTCVEDGVTQTGQSKFLEIVPNQGTGFEAEFTLGAVDPVRVSVSVPYGNLTDGWSVGGGSAILRGKV